MPATTSTPTEASTSDTRSVTVGIVRGLASGARFVLPSGSHVIGRADEVDVQVLDATVSPKHCRVDVRSSDPGGVEVVDLESHNGTRVGERWATAATPLAPGQVARCGAVGVGLDEGAAPPGVSHERPVGTTDAVPDEPVALHRGPRPPRPLPHAIVTLPTAPSAPARVELSWAAILAPLAIGLALALVFSPLLALFALLSPVMVLAGWFENRRRARRHHRHEKRQFGEALAEADSVLQLTRRREARVRRAALPDPAEVVRRAVAADARLWERRAHHDDFLVVSAGHRDQPWAPPVRATPSPDLDPSTRAVLHQASRLTDVPVRVGLRAGEVIGLAGPRRATLAVARHLVAQVVVHHGPADVVVAVDGADVAEPEWSWLAGLPHLARGRPPPGRVVLHVADRGIWAADDPCAAAVVLADRREALPSSCTTVIEALGLHGEGRVQVVDDEGPQEVQLDGLTASSALEVAAALRRFTDPEATDPEQGLPAALALDDLLPGLDADRIRHRWDEGAARAGLPAVIGQAVDGPCVVDLVADGPHALVAGTTGAGKSELLRTFIATLAVAAPPHQVAFVLIDYKGGSAFDACAELPHTVGIVTDLDEQLAERALRSLDAEIRRRERCFRAHRASDLDAYSAATADDPTAERLPRLVVIVDEFATLAADLPAFVESLVGIAQRGRSLGLHLMLATQRPGGAVTDAMRTNLSLRIAMRMVERADAHDVIGSDEATAIPIERHGRGLVRRGAQPPVAFQAAIAQDLPMLVATVCDASTDAARPRRPWLEPLPAPLPLDELHRHASDLAPWELALAVADDPDHQRRRIVTWDLDRGNLFVYGLPGSGTEGALTAAALGLSARYGPDQVHLYVFTSGRHLDQLAELPHVAAVVRAGDIERQQRVVHRLLATLDARRSAAVEHRPRVVLLVDGLDTLLRSLDDPAGLRLADDLVRVLVDGPAAGVHALATADRPGAIPTRATARTEQRLATRLPDPYDYVSLGLRPRHATGQPPGRGIDGSTGLELQLADPDAVDAAFADLVRSAPWDAEARGPAPVHRLPDRARVADLADGSIDHRRPWFVPIGVGDAALETVGFHLHEGDQAIVLGPPRSGRSTLLASVAAQLHNTTPTAVVVGLAPRRSPLTDLALTACYATADHLASFIRAMAPCGQPWFALIDDADLVADDHGALAAALHAGTGNGHLLAAARTDRFRPGLGHWLSTLVGSGPAVVLWPDPHDSHPWPLPPPLVSTARRVPGRGVLLDDGLAETVQVARA